MKERRILFPLEIIKPELVVNQDSLTSNKMILSKFNFISHDQILHLEKSGVYEVEEFLNLTHDNLKYLGFDLLEFESIKHDLGSQLNCFKKLPRKIVSLSKNFAIIGLEKSARTICLGIYWRGLLTLLTCSTENLLALKQRYNLLLEDFNHPDLITYEIDDLPTWISEDSHYSYYFQDPLDIDLSIVKVSNDAITETIIDKEFRQVAKNILCTAYLLDVTEIPSSGKSAKIDSPLKLVLGTGNLESPP